MCYISNSLSLRAPVHSSRGMLFSSARRAGHMLRLQLTSLCAPAHKKPGMRISSSLRVSCHACHSCMFLLCFLPLAINILYRIAIVRVIGKVINNILQIFSSLLRLSRSLIRSFKIIKHCRIIGTQLMSLP